MTKILNETFPLRIYITIFHVRIWSKTDGVCKKLIVKIIPCKMYNIKMNEEYLKLSIQVTITNVCNFKWLRHSSVLTRSSFRTSSLTASKGSRTRSSRFRHLTLWDFFPLNGVCLQGVGGGNWFMVLSTLDFITFRFVSSLWFRSVMLWTPLISSVIFCMLRMSWTMDESLQSTTRRQQVLEKIKLLSLRFTNKWTRLSIESCSS